MNGAEEIASSSTDQLSTLELVSGDLVHLIEVDTSMECDTITSSSTTVASVTSPSMTVESTPCGSHVQPQEDNLKVNAKNIPLTAKVLLQDLDKVRFVTFFCLSFGNFCNDYNYLLHSLYALLNVSYTIIVVCLPALVFLTHSLGSDHYKFQ